MKRAGTLVIALMLGIALTGCATTTGAGLDRSTEVLNSFMEGKVLPGYRYYTTGTHSTPDVIIGLKKEYTLAEGSWKEQSMTTDLLKKTVYLMNDLFGSVETGLTGAYILSDTGDRIGVWYSAVGLTGVEMRGPASVYVEVPNRLMMDKMKSRLTAD